ncbi:MAG: hypothetical protein A2381_06575 [Bdellovibrionales bacterium RIFOXYB1_FULL_37_110]|nr:MAG: hypothetical protein A2181_08595 [Bdellovibrionales bacterium RIFOXYA1_FULL_38_20]OFZ50206.1 MAG: hypothetical protein A2417_19425 [Bdellovibrionales bacterium RIFOXYC1_FULL_37_79]OFZ57643.1 MAG: hypothetical protein A2381_06575 [Bdellovibrionales bacterium RIFOXYB1_FULL_37_110]OFZ61410.1 MAG: hypothetical protein A2577_00940 [Bdellovibrionales bacterium RIFOXYD1_FULL_36_51]
MKLITSITLLALLATMVGCNKDDAPVAQKSPKTDKDTTTTVVPNVFFEETYVCYTGEGNNFITVIPTVVEGDTVTFEVAGLAAEEMTFIANYKALEDEFVMASTEESAKLGAKASYIIVETVEGTEEKRTGEVFTLETKIPGVADISTTCELEANL